MDNYTIQLHENFACDQAVLLDDPHPDAVKQWLDRLPKADLTQSAATIYHSLAQLKNNSLDPHLWFESLQSFDDLVMYFTEMLHQKYLEDSGLNAKTKRQVMALAQALHCEMADNYQKISFEQHDKLRSDVLVQSIYRSLSFASQYFLRCYQLYKTPEPAMLALANQVFHLAEEKNVENVSFSDSNHQQESVTTLTKTFKSILLLLTCSPYQLVPLDLEKIYQQLPDWSDLTRLNKKVSTDDLYVVDLQGDKLPEYLELYKNDLTNSSCRSINCQALTDNLKESLSFVQFGNKKQSAQLTQGLSEFLLHHLHNTWNSLPSRQFSRTQATGSVNACIGLVSTHFFLNSESNDLCEPENTKRKPKVEEDSTFHLDLDASDLGLLPNHKSASPNDYFSGQSKEVIDNRDPWKSVYQKKEPPGLTGKGAPLSQQNNPEFHSWELINSSSNGYCLCTSDEYPDELKAGKIVGLQEQFDESTNYWQIGIIRWIKYTDDNQLQIGIELISPNAIPIGIQTKEQQEHQYKLIRALLLPEIPALEQAQTLIIPRIPFKEKDIVRIANLHIDADVQLLEKVNYSNFFSRYTFTILQHFCDMEEGR